MCQLSGQPCDSVAHAPARVLHRALGMVAQPEVRRVLVHVESDRGVVPVVWPVGRGDVHRPGTADARLHVGESALVARPGHVERLEVGLVGLLRPATVAWVLAAQAEARVHAVEAARLARQRGDHLQRVAGVDAGEGEAAGRVRARGRDRGPAALVDAVRVRTPRRAVGRTDLPPPQVLLVGAQLDQAVGRRAGAAHLVQVVAAHLRGLEDGHAGRVAAARRSRVRRRHRARHDDRQQGGQEPGRRAPGKRRAGHVRPPFSPRWRRVRATARRWRRVVRRGRACRRGTSPRPRSAPRDRA